MSDSSPDVVVVPTEDERVAVRQFCMLSRNLEDQTRVLKREKSTLTAEKKGARDRMYEYMIENDHKACTFTRPDGTTAFVCVKTYSNQSALNEELLRNAIDDITREDVTVVLAGLETPTMQEGIKAAINRSIQQSRVKTKEYVDVLKKPPKGIVAASVPQADEELKEIVREYEAKARALVEKDSSLKEVASEIQDSIVSYEGEVASYMSRAHIASQRVNVADADATTTQTYFIRKKISVTKPRLNKKTVETIVSESVDTVLNAHSDVDAFFTHKQRLIECIKATLDDIPAEEKERITLDKGAVKRSEMTIADGGGAATA